MRRHLFDLGALVVLATIGAGYAALTHPGIRTTALHVYVLVIGAIVMLGIVVGADDVVARRRRSGFDASLIVPREQATRIPGLERIEREVTLGHSSSFDLHFRLLPHLREIAAARLERDGKAPSAETLGRWWELLRPDRPAPDDRFAAGIPEDELRALVADLERL